MANTAHKDAFWEGRNALIFLEKNWDIMTDDERFDYVKKAAVTMDDLMVLRNLASRICQHEIPAEDAAREVLE